VSPSYLSLLMFSGEKPILSSRLLLRQ